MRGINEIHRRIFGSGIDYSAEKRMFNAAVLSMEEELFSHIMSSADPVEEAIKYAAAANYIDFAKLADLDEGAIENVKSAAARSVVDGNTLALSLVSPDGDENYPGMLRVEVRYTLVGGELKIEYAAMSDKKTAINLTNHAYFNLDGAGSGNVLDTFLQIAASRYTPTDETLIPHGEFKDVAGTPFDFRRPHRIGERIGDTDDQDIVYQGGYDVNYVFDKKQGSFEKVCEAESERSGIVMEVFTDKPAVQLYTGNGLAQQGKGGYYNRNYGFCLETQFIPNGVNVPAYAALGDAIYERNKVYHFTTVYKFSVR